MGPLVRFEYPINDSTIQVRQIRGATPSPDGKKLAFTALDRLWVMDLTGCPAGGLHAEAGDDGQRRRAFAGLVARRRVSRLGDVDGSGRRRHARRA